MLSSVGGCPQPQYGADGSTVQQYRACVSRSVHLPTSSVADTGPSAGCCAHRLRDRLVPLAGFKAIGPLPCCPPRHWLLGRGCRARDVRSVHLSRLAPSFVCACSRLVAEDDVFRIQCVTSMVPIRHEWLPIVACGGGRKPWYSSVAKSSKSATMRALHRPDGAFAQLRKPLPRHGERLLSPPRP